MNVTTMVQDFLHDGITYLEQLNDNLLLQFNNELRNAYYNTDHPLLNDDAYDVLENYVKRRLDCKNLDNVVGAEVTKRKVELPVFMGSLSKMKKDDSALRRWKQNYVGEYIISEKLDGISVLWDTRKNNCKLYTRGNGKTGQDISHVIPFIRLPNVENFLIRGEFIMKRAGNISIRNVVAGCISANNFPKDKIFCIEFIPYEVIEPILQPSQQMELLSRHFHSMPKWSRIGYDELNMDFLSNTLRDWRETSIYPMDGIVIAHNHCHERVPENPKHMFAFKMIFTNQTVEIIVTDVLWKESKDGYLKPKIKFDPVKVGGVVNQYATAFHAKYIVENSIGIGSRLLLCRSGDVIPTIQEVLTKTNPKLPDTEYTWNETNCDIVSCSNLGSKQTERVAQCVFFMKMLNVDGLGEKMVEKLHQSGYSSIEKLCAMTKDAIQQVDGIQDKLANKIIDSLHKRLKHASISTLISSSGILGRGYGEKKVKLIIDTFPHWYDSSFDGSLPKGVTTAMVVHFRKHLYEILEFLTNLNQLERCRQKPIKEQTKDKSERAVVFSGFRDSIMKKQLEDLGFVVEETVTKLTKSVIVDSLNNETSKVRRAQKYGIDVVLKDDFLKKHF